MNLSDSVTQEINASGWQFDNTYARLPETLFSAARPATVSMPRVVKLNHELAKQLGLNFSGLSPNSAAQLFAGQVLPAGSQPIAQAYCGHQYGGFTMLGDGRAILLGEQRTPAGTLVDLQFKGSGPTRYSRSGDGCAALGPMLREYLISEAMAALGIPTTRSLCVATTGETVYRITPLRGAILTRVAASHIRVGTFQYLSARRDPETLKRLADYTIDRHYSHLADAPQKYLAFFRAVTDRQAALIAQWQHVGFIHGVMNTDNMAISGETIDYGPCAFMNAYRTDTVFSSIDRHGRYAYGNQPSIGQWNLTRFAESLLPVLDEDVERGVALATEVLNEYPTMYEQHWLTGMRKKLGLQTEQAADVDLARQLLAWMQDSEADFTNTFRELSLHDLSAACHDRDPEFQTWHTAWRQRLLQEGTSIEQAQATMRAVNPAVIPRNHRVEEALSAAEEHDDLAPFEQLLAVLKTPYQDPPPGTDYQSPPAGNCRYQTFCGT